MSLFDPTSHPLSLVSCVRRCVFVLGERAQMSGCVGRALEIHVRLNKKNKLINK